MARKSASGFDGIVIWAVVLVGLTSGCSLVTSDIQEAVQQLNREINALVTVLEGGSNPLLKGSRVRVPAVAPSQKPLYSEAAQRSKVNGELLHEMVSVTYLRDFSDRANFNNYVDTLNQGASIEGIYNGLTHSSDYRKLESESPAATGNAIKVFGEEMNFLAAELDDPLELTERDARPLATPVDPSRGESEELTPAAPATSAPVKSSGQKNLSKHMTPDQYRALFSKASVFTLKRILSDKALKVLDRKKSNPKALALWYGKWVVHMSAYKTDFGLPLRNKADEKFHYQWALNSTEDRLTWEVLNRLHRVLNASNQNI